MSCNLLRGAFYFGLFFRFWGVGFWSLELQGIPFVLEFFFLQAHFFERFFTADVVVDFVAKREIVDQEQKSEGVDACGYVLGQFVALYLLGRRFEDLCHALLKPSFAVDDYLVERIDIRDEEDGVAMKF